jgi:hypothetical protein
MDEVERESLKDEMRNVIEEARMVIPGVQALFGFQTMAVFNQRFDDLPASGVTVYLAGLGLLALAIALLMAPASYHRIAERGQVSRHMINLASRLISLGMIPLAVALALDIYIVCLAALDDARVGVVAACVAFTAFAGFWFAFPLARKDRLRHRRAAQRRGASAA